MRRQMSEEFPGINGRNFTTFPCDWNTQTSVTRKQLLSVWVTARTVFGLEQKNVPYLNAPNFHEYL